MQQLQANSTKQKPTPKKDGVSNLNIMQGFIMVYFLVCLLIFSGKKISHNMHYIK
jgi:hypothetical protein